MTARIRIAAFFTGLLAMLAGERDADACTSFLVTKGASVDGSTMITYAADSHELYGELYHYPAARHAPGSARPIVEWDTGKPLGSIPEVAQTFRVVGNMNERQVAIAETTFGGRKELVDPTGGIDYGSMIYVALQRAATAREAIRVMTGLAEAHGYASKGESFSIADPSEAWIMDFIGKGPGRKGAVWVAVRVPDGYVSAHANQPRIGRFPRNTPDECVYAPDVVSFAREKGWYSGADEDFVFADAYGPPTCKDLRAREGRVWSFFRAVAPSQPVPSDYVKCKPGAAPMPLWIKPDKKLSARDLMERMRDHFEGTEFDMRNDVGAGPFALPYRWRPMDWNVDGHTYMHERATATQQTGFSFVSQSRSFLPDPVGGLLWFSVDDAASTVYVPMYSGIRRAPKPYAVGTGTFERFSWDSAFWVFNWVASQAYGRYGDVIKDIQRVQGELEGGFLAEQPRIEQKAAALHKTSPGAAEDFLTRYSAESGERVVVRWRALGEELMVKYLDGNVRDEKGKITHPRYPDEWYRRIVAEKGDHLRLPAAPASASASNVPAAASSLPNPPTPEPSASSAPPKAGCSVRRAVPSERPWWLAIGALGVARRVSRRRIGKHEVQRTK